MSSIVPRRSIAVVNLLSLTIFVCVGFLFSYAYYPTPRLMLFIVTLGILFRVVEWIGTYKLTQPAESLVFSLACLSIGWNLVLPFLLAATTRQFHTHYFGLLILPVLEAALYFTLPGVLFVCCLASACDAFWVVYAANFRPPYQVGEMLESATLVLLYFVVGILTWWLMNRLAQREDQLRQQMFDLESTRTRLVEEEKFAAIGRLAGAVAHEIRTPVAIISSAIEAASSPAFSPQDREEMSQVAVAEAKRLEKLTTDFLAYAQPSATPFSEIDGSALVGYIVSIARPQGLPKKLQFSVVNDDSCPIRGNEGQLQQVLLNLVLNAIEASPESGHIHVQARSTADRVAIAIENEGAPIPADAVPRIFEPFFTAKPGGTGLGLAIARNITEKHGGEIRLAHNNKDKIVFILTLPLRGVAEMHPVNGGAAYGSYFDR